MSSPDIVFSGASERIVAAAPTGRRLLQISLNCA